MLVHSLPLLNTVHGFLQNLRLGLVSLLRRYWISTKLLGGHLKKFSGKVYRPPSFVRHRGRRSSGGD